MEKDSILLLFSISIFLFSISGIIGTYSSILEFSNFMTGNGIEEGVINLSVADVVSLNFTNGVIDFGPGNVTEGAPSALIDTLGGVANGSWTPTTGRFRITNTGNTNLRLNLSSGKTANEFIGGEKICAGGNCTLYNPSYKFNLTASISGCKPGGGFNLGTFQEVNKTPDSIAICTYLLPGENITIDLQLRIPDDSKIGILEDSISITYEQAS